MARGPIIAWVESSVHQRLTEVGLDLHYARRSWSLASGLRLEQVTLHRIEQGDHPLAEVSALTVWVSMAEWFKTRALVTHWSLKDASVTVHDAEGAITFERVSARIVGRPGQIETPQLDLQQGPRTFALHGQILYLQSAAKPPAPWTLDLFIARGVLAVLDLKAGHAPFAVQGSYLLDFRSAEPGWQADLTGSGRDIVWQGVPLQKAAAQGRFTPAGLDVTAQLQVTAGSADVSLKRQDWGDSPLVIAGTLTDGAKQTDKFSAAYEFATRLLTVSDLRGKAHLLEYARNFPMLIPYLPAYVKFQKFPDLLVSNFTYSFAGATGAWSAGSIQTRSPGELTLQLGGDPIKAGGVEGLVACEGGHWKVQLASGPISWRDLSAPGASINGTLAASRLQAKLDLRLNKGSVAFELSSADWTHAPLLFTGNIADSQGLIDRVSGSYQRDPEELRFAQLTGKANLLEFAGNFPGLTEHLPNTFQFRAFPEIAVSDLRYRSGHPPTLGSLRLVTPTDLTITVRRRPVAFEGVEGQVAFDGDVWKFSRMHGRVFGGQWSMEGIYQGGALRDAKITASGVHLAEAKAWMGDSPKEIGDAVLALEYSGNIGAELAEFTGAGHIRLENAPLIKVPLLDQTYELASALSSPMARHGAGRLDATFVSRDGVAKVSKFIAASDSVKVTAEGTVDLRRRQVSGRAHGNLRGLFGIVTGPLSRTLEMEVSGPLDNIRVRPLGLKGILNVPKSIVPDTAKGASRLIEKGALLPLRIFDVFKADSPAVKQ